MNHAAAQRLMVQYGPLDGAVSTPPTPHVESPAEAEPPIILDPPGLMTPERAAFRERVAQATLADRVQPAVQAPSDPVFRPHHYARFVIDPVTFAEANRLSFAAGNVIKYVCREDAKNGLEDLMKARRYLDIMIEVKARRARVEAGEPAEDVWKERL